MVYKKFPLTSWKGCQILLQIKKLKQSIPQQTQQKLCLKTMSEQNETLEQDLGMLSKSYV